MSSALSELLPSPYETPSSDTSPPKNKGGRPRGSKTRPKWLRDQLKAKVRKGQVGRPKGSKNKPKIAEFFLESFANVDQPPPPKPPKVAYNARDWLKKKSPKYRQIVATHASHARKKGNRYRAGDLPKGWTLKQFLPVREAAKAEAKRIMKIMEKDGILPDDQMAREALQMALQMMREPHDKNLKMKALRTVLEYTKAKPATKSDVTIRTAEDFLDELAAKETNERDG